MSLIPGIYPGVLNRSVTSASRLSYYRVLTCILNYGLLAFDNMGAGNGESPLKAG